MLELHRPAGVLGARGIRGNGLPRAVQLIGRAERRGDADGAGRPDRGRAPVGRASPARLSVSRWASELIDELLEVARRGAARMAGELLSERSEPAREREVSSKSTPTDLVSEADLAAEQAIRALLARGARRWVRGGGGRDERGTSGLRWVVDPLDGTVNFLFGIPQWCVSVAVRDRRGDVGGRGV